MTLDEILNDEMFNLTETEVSLFNTSKLPNRKFNSYESRTSDKTVIDFEVTKSMKLESFNGSVEINSYFVLNGVTGFLKAINNNNRTEIYFDNGTKSKMLYKSLVSMMNKTGKKFK